MLASVSSLPEELLCILLFLIGLFTCLRGLLSYSGGSGIIGSCGLSVFPLEYKLLLRLSHLLLSVFFFGLLFSLFSRFNRGFLSCRCNLGVSFMTLFDSGCLLLFFSLFLFKFLLLFYGFTFLDFLLFLLAASFSFYLLCLAFFSLKSAALLDASLALCLYLLEATLLSLLVLRLCLMPFVSGDSAVFFIYL